VDLLGHWHQVYALSSAAAHALGDPGLEALHLNYLARALSVCLSLYQDAIDSATRALTIATEAGDTLQQAWAHWYIAWSCIRLGDYARAERHAREAVADLEAAGHRGAYPQIIGVLGDSLRGLGRRACAARTRPRSGGTGQAAGSHASLHRT
jgi:tetratricopeptide (TPR) repeat protein